MSVASSEIFSLMLSLRLRSTALCDSRRRLRFSFAIRALCCRVPAARVRTYVTEGLEWRGERNEAGRATHQERN